MPALAAKIECEALFPSYKAVHQCGGSEQGKFIPREDSTAPLLMAGASYIALRGTISSFLGARGYGLAKAGSIVALWVIAVKWRASVPGWFGDESEGCIVAEPHSDRAGRRGKTRSRRWVRPWLELVDIEGWGQENTSVLKLVPGFEG